VPFLLITVISSLAADRGWLRSGRLITLWSLVAFLALAKYGYFGSIYLNSLDTLQATREAIAQVQTKGGVLTTAEIAPHLTHRQLIKLTDANSPPADLTQFDYVLLNVRHPGWLSNSEFAGSLVINSKILQNFSLVISAMMFIYLLRKGLERRNSLTLTINNYSMLISKAYNADISIN
jgi:uncharacterized membrane protein